MELDVRAAKGLTTEDVLLVLQDRLERYKRQRDLKDTEVARDKLADKTALLDIFPPMIDNTPRITLAQLAERLQMDRSACRKHVLKSGYKPEKMRTADSGFQIALTVTEIEARALQAARARDGYCQPPA